MRVRVTLGNVFVTTQARIHPNKIIQLPIVHSTCVHTFAKNIYVPLKRNYRLISIIILQSTLLGAIMIDND